jgi:hypothetical protein
MARQHSYLAYASLILMVTAAANACEIIEFAYEGLLRNEQNTLESNFEQLQAFAAGHGFPTVPLFTPDNRRIETGLDSPIDVSRFGYAVVHYDPGTSPDPAGGLIVFYFIETQGFGCQFLFPIFGPRPDLANGPITSVDLFKAHPISDAGVTFVQLASGMIALSAFRRFVQS